ncbi:MAG: hypothetical protein WA792_17425 [Pseudolabrys sp.]|jgi:hypothetical protein
MPLYYFDARNEENLLDDRGIEMRDVDEAKAEAVGYLVDAARGHFDTKTDRQELFCTVKDDSGKQLLRVRLVLQIATPSGAWR